MTNLSATTPIKAVFFDLDDTLFDHRHSNLCGLGAVQRDHEYLTHKSLAEVEREYLLLSDAIWPRVMQGELTIDHSRVERLQLLARQYGTEITTEDALVYATSYRVAYQTSRRAIPGAHDLLRALRVRQPGVIIGVITNNLVAEQREKIQHVALDTLIDFMVVSEEVGTPKPDPHIFEVALKRANCTAAEAVMIGDSWRADIQGAHALGMRAIWVNWDHKPLPDPSIAVEIRALEPVDELVRLILD